MDFTPCVCGFATLLMSLKKSTIEFGRFIKLAAKMEASASTPRRVRVAAGGVPSPVGLHLISS